MRIYHIILSLATIFAVLSCQPASDNVAPRPLSSRHQVRVSVKPPVPEDETKSSLSINENSVENINVFVYQNGVLTSQDKTFYNYNSSELEDIEVQMVRGVSYRIYAIANVGKVRPFQTADSLLSYRFDIGDYDYFDPEGTGTVPMVFASDEVTSSAGALNVSLERLVAHYVLQLAHDSLDVSGSRFTATSIRLRQAAVSVQPFSSESHAEVPAHVADGDSASVQMINMFNSGGQIDFYTMENVQGELLEGNDDPVYKNPDGFDDPSMSELCTYIEIRGNYSGGGQYSGLSNEDMTYRFYLGGNATSDFSVLRNHEYTITIQPTNDGTFTLPSWRIEPGILTDSRTIAFSPDTLRIDCRQSASSLVTTSPAGLNYEIEQDIRDWAGKEDAVSFTADGGTLSFESLETSEFTDTLHVYASLQGFIRVGETAKRDTLTVILLKERLDSLWIEPSEFDLAKGQSKTFKVWGHYTSGDTSEVTNQCEWTFSDDCLSRAGSSSTFTGIEVSNNTLFVTASCEGLSATATGVITPARLYQLSIQVKEPSIVNEQATLGGLSVIVKDYTAGFLYNNASFPGWTTEADATGRANPYYGKDTVEVDRYDKFFIEGRYTDGTSFGPHGLLDFIDSNVTSGSTTATLGDVTVSMYGMNFYNESFGGSNYRQVSWYTSSGHSATHTVYRLYYRPNAKRYVIGSSNATITAYATADSTNVNATATINVNTRVVSGFNIQGKDYIGVGQWAQFNAFERANYNDKNVTNDSGTTWSSSNDNIATVNSSGVVTGISPGSVSITAQYHGWSNSYTSTVFERPRLNASRHILFDGDCDTLTARFVGNLLDGENWQNNLLYRYNYNTRNTSPYFTKNYNGKYVILETLNASDISGTYIDHSFFIGDWFTGSPYNATVNSDTVTVRIYKNKCETLKAYIGNDETNNSANISKNDSLQCHWSYYLSYENTPGAELFPRTPSWSPKWRIVSGEQYATIDDKGMLRANNNSGKERQIEVQCYYYYESLNLSLNSNILTITVGTTAPARCRVVASLPENASPLAWNATTSISATYQESDNGIDWTTPSSQPDFNWEITGDQDSVVTVTSPGGASLNLTNRNKSSDSFNINLVAVSVNNVRSNILSLTLLHDTERLTDIIYEKPTIDVEYPIAAADETEVSPNKKTIRQYFYERYVRADEISRIDTTLLNPPVSVEWDFTLENQDQTVITILNDSSTGKLAFQQNAGDERKLGEITVRAKANGVYSDTLNISVMQAAAGTSVEYRLVINAENAGSMTINANGSVDLIGKIQSKVGGGDWTDAANQILLNPSWSVTGSAAGFQGSTRANSATLVGNNSSSLSQTVTVNLSCSYNGIDYNTSTEVTVLGMVTKTTITTNRDSTVADGTIRCTAVDLISYDGGTSFTGLGDSRTNSLSITAGGSFALGAYSDGQYTLTGRNSTASVQDVTVSVNGASKTVKFGPDYVTDVDYSLSASLSYPDIPYFGGTSTPTLNVQLDSTVTWAVKDTTTQGIQTVSNPIIKKKSFTNRHKNTNREIGFVKTHLDSLDVKSDGTFFNERDSLGYVKLTLEASSPKGTVSCATTAGVWQEAGLPERYFLAFADDTTEITEIKYSYSSKLEKVGFFIQYSSGKISQAIIHPEDFHGYNSSCISITECSRPNSFGTVDINYAGKGNTELYATYVLSANLSLIYSTTPIPVICPDRYVCQGINLEDENGETVHNPSGFISDFHIKASILDLLNENDDVLSDVDITELARSEGTSITITKAGGAGNFSFNDTGMVYEFSWWGLQPENPLLLTIKFTYEGTIQNFTFPLTL